MIRLGRRGRLKVYLGYGAGVGKTYLMLLEGHRLKDEGIDVVIGLVETHGRPETAKLIEGLDVVPRRRQEYRGHVLDEMDVDAILQRRPEVALIDELAHANVPGSRYPKRYQDVQDILAAGIHVITTLNVQHLESLYDTVEKTVHVKVRERLPDTVIAEADEIVNVDLTTEDLQERLREGKIYPPDRAETALANFFTTSNLEKLRELTLREIASQIDLRRRGSDEEENEPAPDQVMVCLSSRGPNSEALLRYASRLAGRLNRNWYAVYVQTPSEEPTVIDAQTQQFLSGTLTLAKQLGALVFTYKGEDIADTVLRFAREYRVGHIVLGYPGRVPFWRRLLGKKSIVEQLIAKSRGVTVVLLDTRPTETPAARAEAGLPPIVKPTRAAPSVSAGPLSLSYLLSSRRIIIWDRPVDKDPVLRALAEVAAKDLEGCNADAILAAVRQREDQGSTFFNEGVAFPHARIEGIARPVMALGLTRKGVVDESAGKPIELVFLILSPAHLPDMQVQALALASKAAQSQQLVQSLSSVRNAEEAFSAVQDWEMLRGPRGIESS
ncbi:MAG: PTS sugar transporter subunit IIA [Desulfomonile tiedjei]|nr:PTS sugar transporter subunit IIA [Desulfomonile tiedjei]